MIGWGRTQRGAALRRSLKRAPARPRAGAFFGSVVAVRRLLVTVSRFTIEQAGHSAALVVKVDETSPICRQMLGLCGKPVVLISITLVFTAAINAAGSFCLLFHHG